ncbi:MAG: Ig-like domain-containing protein [Pseudomonadota bacterium]
MNHLKRYTRTLLCSMGFLVVAMLAACGGGNQGRDPILGLPAADLVSVLVSPATATIASGAVQQFVATATFADGSSRDVSAASNWVSGTPAVATVNSASGLASGLGAGSAAITASYGGKSGSATLTVTAVTLRSIAVTPANPALALGAQQQMHAMGTFSDGSTRDITAIASFSSATPAVATIVANTGLATAVKAGNTVITATSGALSGSTTLTVNPAVLTSIAVAPQNPTVQIGATRQLTVTATYSDGGTTDVTAASTYTSGTPAAVGVNAAGLTSGLAAGSSVVTARFGGQSASTTVTVPAVQLLALTVNPASATVAIGGLQRYIATATYSDGATADISASVKWTSDNTAVATVLQSGIATGRSAGSATITATAGAKSANATLNVTAPLTLTSIAVTPANSTMLVGAFSQFTATATYSDGTTANISASANWTSGNTAVATVVPGGLVSSLGGGITSITASLNGISGNAALTVTQAAVTLTGITITPPNPVVTIGDAQQFTATGTYSNNTTANLTTQVTWSVSSAGVASISAGGLAQSLSVGVTNVTATLNNQGATTTLTVNPTRAQALSINLGTATTFGVLSGTTITNNAGGTTLVTGDVGAATQITDPPQAPGFQNYKAGAVLTKALADLQTAVLEANGRVCDTVSAAGIDLGGRTLPPGIYCFAGPITNTGILTLNAQGLYIFRTASTLSTSANSSVVLSGGALADNVFWAPVGATTLGTNSVFKGTILSAAGAINVGNNTTLVKGRVLTGAAVTLSNNAITK